MQLDTAAVTRVVTRASWRGRIHCAGGRDRTAVSPLAQLSSSSHGTSGVLPPCTLPLL